MLGDLVRPFHLQRVVIDDADGDLFIGDDFSKCSRVPTPPALTDSKVMT